MKSSASAPTWPQNALGEGEKACINAYHNATILHALPEHLGSTVTSQMFVRHAHMALAQTISVAPQVTHAQTGLRATHNVARRRASMPMCATQVKDV
mmetsp:Transcript_54360/g.99502  ORF Transcript_54360/g.99502 Transcript_54360/m.99502 type:complete len:97 (-) Transcript_54360:506-796(-)